MYMSNIYLMSPKNVPMVSPPHWRIFGWKNISLCPHSPYLVSGFSTMRLLALSKIKNRSKSKTFWHHTQHWEDNWPRESNWMPFQKKISRNASNHGIQRWDKCIDYQGGILIEVYYFVRNKTIHHIFYHSCIGSKEYTCKVSERSACLVILISSFLFINQNAVL